MTITFNITPVYDGKPAKNITQSDTEDGTVKVDIASDSSVKDSGGKDSGSKDSSTKGFALSTDTFSPKETVSKK